MITKRDIMIESRKIKIISKLILIIGAAFFLGLYSCGGDDGTKGHEWKYVGDVRDEQGENVSVFIDLKGMHIEGNIRKFWIRYYAKKDGSQSKETYIRQLGFWEVDCNDRTLYVLGEEYYGVDGQVLGRTEERFKEDYKQGTIGDKLASSACRYAGRD